MSRKNSLILGFILIFAFSWIKSVWALVYIFLLLAALRGGVSYAFICALAALVGAGINSFLLYGKMGADIVSHLFMVLISVGLGHLFIQLEKNEPTNVSSWDFKLPSLPTSLSVEEELLPEAENLPYEIRQKRIQLKVSLDVSQKLDNLLDFVHDYLKPHSLVLFMYDAAADYLKVNKYRTAAPHFDREALINSGQGLVGWIARIQKPLHIKDISQHSGSLLYYQGEHTICSFLGVPIFSDKRFVGVLSVDSTETEYFNESDVKLLEWCGKLIVQAMLGADEKRLFLQQVAEVSLLYEASQDLNASLNEEDILKSLVNTASEIVGQEKTVFLGWKGEKAELKVEAEVGFYPALANYSEKVTKDNILSWVIHHSQALRVNNIQERLNPELKHNPIYQKMHSCMGLPLIVGEQLRGILLLVSRRRRRFNQMEQENLTILTNLAAFALSKADLYSQMKKMANTDGLTKLFNHQYFERKLAQEMARARRYHKNLSLVLLDIDHFKNINDNFGHMVGDEVLRMLGKILQDEMRDIDIASRYGGEEFVLILPETNLENAFRVAERLRLKIANGFGGLTPMKDKITISLGVGTFPLHGEREEDLLSNVDSALYTAKNNGRNQTVSCTEKQKALK